MRRSIYQTCITSIRDYDVEIWFNAQKSQKSYLNQLQKLQNSTIRNILGSFCIASIETLKIESNTLSIKSCMYRKMIKYALHTMKMIKNYAIYIRTPIFYFSEYQNQVFDENFIQWNENEKRHTSWLNWILNTITSYINQIDIKNNEI